MVPHKIVILDTFPLDLNGKVDRTSLRRRSSLYDSNNMGCDGVQVIADSPSTELEAFLLETLSSVVGLPTGAIGVTQDLFHLVGLNSLGVIKFTME